MYSIYIDQAINLLRKAGLEQVIENAPLSSVLAAYHEAKQNVLSPHTISDYNLTFRRLSEFIPTGKLMSDINSSDIRRFLATIPGSKKNRKNAHIALSSLWTFALRYGYARQHIVHDVEIAKPETRAVIPFSKLDIEKLLQAAQESRRKSRDIAIVKLLLDTGIRASELCGLRVDDLEGEYLRVLGKGSKERRVPVSYSAISAVLDYLGTRHAIKRNAPAFVSEQGLPLNRDSLRQMIERTGIRAGVNNAHPHKFRHTFALNYLLNGGDPYSLQIILGHSTMDMVKRYLYLTNRDVSAVHDRVSPLKNWGL